MRRSVSIQKRNSVQQNCEYGKSTVCCCTNGNYYKIMLNLSEKQFKRGGSKFALTAAMAN